jgi:hypothetical protein
LFTPGGAREVDTFPLFHPTNLEAVPRDFCDEKAGDSIIPAEKNRIIGPKSRSGFVSRIVLSPQRISEFVMAG